MTANHVKFEAIIILCYIVSKGFDECCVYVINRKEAIYHVLGTQSESSPPTYQSVEEEQCAFP